LEIKGEYFTLKAKGKDDWTEIPIPAKVSGLPVTISMNRTYLAKALKFGFAQIDIKDKTSPLVFNATGKMLVVCPLGYQAAGKVPVAPTTPPTSPTENASAAATPAATATTPPVEQTASQPTPEPPTEERNDMPRTARTARTTSLEPTARVPATAEVQNNSGNNGSNNGNGTTSPVKPLVDQVETIKDGLKAVIRDLSTVVDTLKQAEKEKRGTEKEIEAVRTKLRQIQNVTI